MHDAGSFKTDLQWEAGTESGTKWFENFAVSSEKNYLQSWDQDEYWKEPKYTALEQWKDDQTPTCGRLKDVKE